jgi:hypothetical protein
MRNELMYDLMLEVEGILRSRALRIRRERELEPGDVLDLDGRRWEVTQVVPSRSLRVDRRVVAREIVSPLASTG